MALIRSKDTKPELIVRSQLHRAGLRYVLHDRRLPGRPDLVFPRHGAVVFVHGCFWHGHSCGIYKPPKSNSAFWRHKIEANRRRDERNKRLLRIAGWRVYVVRECHVASPKKAQSRILRLAKRIAHKPKDRISPSRAQRKASRG
jgi:DNA mismatch endonuclease (patch repair protein)